MFRKSQRLRQAAIIWVVLSLALVLGTAKLPAQALPHGESHCFAIRVHLNGKLIRGPQSITFKTKESEKETSLEGGCFNVPLSVLNEKTIDILFAVPKNKIYLSAIPTVFLTGPWDIELEDNSFRKDVVLPKRARIREACAAVFHVGEPESSRTFTKCRSEF